MGTGLEGESILFLDSNLAPTPHQDSQHDGLMCACVCPLKTLDLTVKHRHLDPFTDQMICKLIALPPTTRLRGGEKRFLMGKGKAENYKTGKGSQMTLYSIEKKYFPVNGECVFGHGALHFHRAALPWLPEPVGR